MGLKDLEKRRMQHKNYYQTIYSFTGNADTAKRMAKDFSIHKTLSIPFLTRKYRLAEVVSKEILKALGLYEG